MEKVIIKSKIFENKISIDLNSDTSIFELSSTIKLLINTAVNEYTFPNYV